MLTESAVIPEDFSAEILELFIAEQQGLLQRFKHHKFSKKAPSIVEVERGVLYWYSCNRLIFLGCIHPGLNAQAELRIALYNWVDTALGRSLGLPHAMLQCFYLWADSATTLTSNHTLSALPGSFDDIWQRYAALLFSGKRRWSLLQPNIKIDAESVRCAEPVKDIRYCLSRLLTNTKRDCEELRFLTAIYNAYMADIGGEVHPLGAEGLDLPPSGQSPSRWLFLLHSIGPVGDGIMYSAMRRARLFAKYSLDDVWLISCDWALDYQAREVELRRMGLIPTNARMVNVFDSLLSLRGDGKITPFPKSALLALPHGVNPRTEVNDSGLMRRVSMSRLHKLYRHEYYGDNEELLCRFEKDVSTGQPDGVRITLFNENGNEVCFNTEESFREYVISLLLPRDSRWYLVIDENLHYQNLLSSPYLQDVDKKVFAVIHNTHMEANSRKLKIFFRTVLSKPQDCDAIIALTHRQADDIHHYGVPREKIVVIPHARNLQLGWDDNGLRIPGRIVSLARYAPVKRHKLMFEVFAEVIKLAPHASLYTYGSGPLKHSLREFVKQLGLEGKIVVHDHAANVDAIYREAELSILTSVEEGFPLFCIESITHGVPMAALDIKYGPQDILEEPRCGVLVDPAQPMDLVGEIAELLRNRQALDALRANIPAAASKFSEQATLALWQQLIND